jgi:type I restriction enzyme S subunit
MGETLFKNKKLGDIVHLGYGKGLPKRDRLAGIFPVYGSGGVVDSHNAAIVKGPGIIVGRKGSIGTIYYEKKDFYPIDTVYFVEVKNRETNIYYLSKLMSQIGLENLNTDAAVPGLNRDVALSQEVLVPPYKIQNKIAYILSAYDDLIENNLRRIKILEEMAQNLYREWFVNFRFPDHEKARFVDSPLGRIPEGWKVAKVGELLEKLKKVAKIPRSNYAINGLWPVIDQGKDFIGGYTDDQESIISSELPLIVFGDHTRVLKYIDFPFARGADGTQLLKSNNKRMPMSLFYYSLLAIDLSNYAYARHFKFLKDEMVLLPDRTTAEAFDQFLNPILDNNKKLMEKNVTLRQTRDLLLPKLISGEVDVSELDISVPEEAAS